jgi:hypothetical protein
MAPFMNPGYTRTSCPRSRNVDWDSVFDGQYHIFQRGAKDEMASGQADYIASHAAFISNANDQARIRGILIEVAIDPDADQVAIKALGAPGVAASPSPTLKAGKKTAADSGSDNLPVADSPTPGKKKLGRPPKAKAQPAAPVAAGNPSRIAQPTPKQNHREKIHANRKSLFPSN